MDNWITVYPSATSILKIFHSTRNSRIGLVKVNEDWSVIKITEESVKKIHTYRLTEERIYTKICVSSITRVLSILSLAGRSIDCWKTLNDETYTRDASWLPRSLVAVVLFIERYLQQ